MAKDINISRQDIAQYLLRALIGSSIGGVGAMAQNEHGVVLGALMISLGVSVFMALLFLATD